MGVSSILLPSVRIIACSTLIIWAMFAIFIRSGMAVKDVEAKRRHLRIAQRVLLIKEAVVAAGLLYVPAAPLIDI